MESHRLRLAEAGLLERLKLRQGEEALVWATTLGARAAGMALSGLRRVPAPTTWEHHLAVGWAAALFTVRGRALSGGRELLADDRWSQEISWSEHAGYRRSGHRPDLVTHGPGGERRAVEVELTVKSRARVRAVLDMYADSRAVDQVLYVVSDPLLARHIRRCQRHSRLEDERLIVVALADVRQLAHATPRQRFRPPERVGYEVRLTAEELKEHERAERHVAATRRAREQEEQAREDQRRVVSGEQAAAAQGDPAAVDLVRSVDLSDPRALRATYEG